MAIIEPILNDQTAARVEAQIRSGGKNSSNRVFPWSLLGALLFALLVLGVLVVDVVGDAWPVLTGRLGDFLASSSRSAADESGVFQGLRGTFWIGVFVIVLTFPLGIAAAVYLEE